MAWPEWNGDDIAGLTLHRPVAVVGRLDVLPFVAAYGFWIYYCATASFSSFWVALGSVALVTTHLLVFLLQYWSLKFRVLVGYVTVKSLGERDEEDIQAGRIRARAVPHPHCGKPEFARLQIDNGRVHFSFHMRSYEYNRETGRFEVLEYPEHWKLEDYLTYVRSTGGLNDDSIVSKMFRYGANRIEIPLPKFLELYQEQLLSPFFVFQVFCILLWVLDAYWQYFAMTLTMMLVFEATVVKGRLRSLTELRGMRNRPSRIHAYRNRKWVLISSMEILPGDVISLGRAQSPDIVVPCDCLILSGGAVVNEAMLTGESVPLMKEGIYPAGASDLAEELQIMGKDKGHILFGGTRILSHTSATVCEATPPSKAPDGACVCIALRTGFGSSQGILLRTILASTEKVSANSWEAAFFILFLLIFALLASGYVLVNSWEDEERSKYKLLLHCVLIITSVIPPELPMQLALAVNASLVALAREFVFCTEPFRIPFAGKVDVCCFDKTGTLTTDNIKAVGVAEQPDDSRESATSQEYPLVETNMASFDVASVLAGCQSLVYVDDELVGDPLELAALHGVEWTYTRSESAVPKKGSAGRGLKILNRYRFVSKLQRMSTVAQVQNGGADLPPRALVKGSPEAVGKLLRSMPDHYDATAFGLARRGLRVLALAFKDLDQSLTPSGLKAIPREEIEKDLAFAGFIAFECPLRPDSKKNVKQLRSSSHRVVMITGDAVLTAIHVAKEVALIGKKCLSLEALENELFWSLGSTGARYDTFSAADVKSLSSTYDLAIAGPVLASPLLSQADLVALLPCVKIFARMAPEQKERVLTGYKDMGLTTLMCGDGTNDVGALKQANVGVALLSFVSSEPATQSNSTDAEMVRMRKKGDLTGQKNVHASRSKAGDKTKNAEKSKSKSKGAASQAKSTESARDSSNKSASGQQRQQNGTDLSDEKLAAMTPEERRKYELRKKLDLQIKELNSVMEGMDDDGPKLVKLGDASIASPFTSKKMSISSCTTIIRQGRCTLATTLQMYQILALNCLISAYGLSVLYLEGVKFGDRQMTLSGIVIAGAFFFITRGKPLQKLSAQRPASSVFHPSLFLSLIAQFGVHLGCLFVAVSAVKKYLPKDFDADVDGPFEPSLLNTVVFLVSTAQQVVVFAVNYKGHPFMEGLRDNKVLQNTLVVNFVVVILLALEIVPEINKYVELVELPDPALRLQICQWIIMDAGAAFMLDRMLSYVLRPRPRAT